MATSETQELALLLDEHRPEWDGAGFPRWLRVRVATHVVSERSAGTSLAALSAGLGVSAPTLRRWTHAHSDAEWGATITVARISHIRRSAPGHSRI